MGGGLVFEEMPRYSACDNSPYAARWVPIYDTSFPSLRSNWFGYFDDDFVYEHVPAPISMVEVPLRREFRAPAARKRKLEGGMPRDLSYESVWLQSPVRKEVDAASPNNSTALKDEKMARRPQFVAIPVTSSSRGEMAKNSAAEETRRSLQKILSPADPSNPNDEKMAWRPNVVSIPVTPAIRGESAEKTLTEETERPPQKIPSPANSGAISIPVSIPVTSAIRGESAEKTLAEKTERSPQKTPSPANLGAISIPVTFIDVSASTAQDALIAGDGTKPSRTAEEEAAILIQTRFRGHGVRMSDPLKHLRKIASVKYLLSAFIGKTSDDGYLQCAREHAAEKAKLTEGIMDLLLQLDAIQGAHPVVRDARRAIVKQVISLQEKVDAVFSVKRTVENLEVREAKVSEETRAAVDEEIELQSPATTNSRHIEMGADSETSEEDIEVVADAVEDLHHSNVDGDVEWVKGTDEKGADNLENSKTNDNDCLNVVRVDFGNGSNGDISNMELDTGRGNISCQTRHPAASHPEARKASSILEEMSKQDDAPPPSHADKLREVPAVDEACESAWTIIGETGNAHEKIVANLAASADVTLRNDATADVKDDEASIPRSHIQVPSAFKSPSEVSSPTTSVAKEGVRPAEHLHGQISRFEHSPRCPSKASDVSDMDCVDDAPDSNRDVGEQPEENTIAPCDSRLTTNGEASKLVSELTHENRMLKSLLIGFIKTVSDAYKPQIK